MTGRPRPRDLTPRSPQINMLAEQETTEILRLLWNRPGITSRFQTGSGTAR